MASSSSDASSGIQSASERRKPDVTLKLYDVFISHRGPDVKETLAKTLYNSFEMRGIRAFLDREEIEGGDFFPSAIENAIRSASVQVVILSKGFAESPWCLKEVELMVQSESRILPIFYQVAPHELRYVEKGVYAKAFAKYEEKKRHVDKLPGWKKALEYVSNINGYELDEDKLWKKALNCVSSILGCELSNYNDDEDKLCEKVVYAVQRAVEKTRPLEVAKSPVGLDKLVEDFERQCMQNHEENNNNVKIVGIFGMGGVGKTTLATELFNRMRSDYDGSCFLLDVREASYKGQLTTCQSKILNDLVHDIHPLSSIKEGKSRLKSRMEGSDKRFLIIMDDIDRTEQLDDLVVGDVLKSGSLIILTTRDKSVLINAQITLCYEMKGMNICDSRQLFCSHAFRQQPHPESGYEDLVESFVEACCGLPLSLRVLGSQVCGRPKRYWELELVKIRRILPGDIMKRLKISFDDLDDHEKQIFMDIACFFIGKQTSLGIRIWEGSGWSGELAIQTLKDRSLVEEVKQDKKMDYRFQDEHYIEREYVLRMHDHLRDLGRELADKLSSPRRIWRPQHLESWKGVQGFQNILTETNVRCFSEMKHGWLDLAMDVTYFVGNSNFSTETSTVPLLLELYHLTSNDMHIDFQAFCQLKELKLHTVTLKEFPDSIGMLNCLEKLKLHNVSCGENLPIEGKSLSESVTKLTNLKFLKLGRMNICGELALNNCGESTTCKLSSLQKIHIELSGISKLSICGVCCPCLNIIILSNNGKLNEVNLRRVTILKSLRLNYCLVLEGIFIEDLQELTNLSIESCPKLQGSLDLKSLNCMELISIIKCPKLQNMRGIEDLQELKYLEIIEVNESARDCIHSLKRLPSVTIATGNTYDGVKSDLKVDLFSGIVDVDAITEIRLGEKVSVKTPESLSAIIICALVRVDISFNLLYANQQISFPSAPGDSWLRQKFLLFGWDRHMIVTIVMAGNNVRCAQDYIDQSKWIGERGSFYVCKEKGYMVRVKKGEEEKALHILRRVIVGLYMERDVRRGRGRGDPSQEEDEDI